MTDERRDRTELRTRQQQLDVELLRVLTARAQLSMEWARSHPEAQAPSLSQDAEALDALTRELEPVGLRALARQMLSQVQASCRALETPLQVGFLGAEGATVHVAALDRFGVTVSLLPVATAREAIERVQRQQLDAAMIPFETHGEWNLLPTLLALRATDVKITGLLEWSAPRGLLTRGASLEQVDRVFATAADRQACQRFLGEHLARVALVDVRLAREACEAAVREPSAAAIALEPFGATFGLSPIAKGISDEREQASRFVVLGSRPVSRTGKDATSLVLSINDEPGALFAALQVFAERGVNLRKIESCHTDEEASGLLFYLEISGHVTDRPLVTAIEILKRQTQSIKVLGSYPL